MPHQRKTMGIDFGKYVTAGITLTSTPILLLSTSFGSDPNPQSRVIGGPTINTLDPGVGGTGLHNTGVAWQVDQCLPGVTYVADVYCPSSDGDVVEASVRFSCVPAS